MRIKGKVAGRLYVHELVQDRMECEHVREARDPNGL